MCGIAGGIGALRDDVLFRMAEKMSHRGPDNIAIMSENEVHLAHARLSIIDLSVSSNQPLWDSQRRACIVFNGEIYNFEELRTELLEQGVEFRSHGDAEVLLNLYLHEGMALFEKVSGIFSFAIWDANKEKLVLARDHFGVKPLYFSENKDGFFFASEIKSLLEIDSIERSINYDALFRTLTFLYSPGRDTLLSSVKKVSPGEYLVVVSGKVVERVDYWKWPSYSPQDISPEEHANRILSVLSESVNDQLVSDVPLGAFLSGGLDSSLLVALASESKKSNLPCFTIDANNGKSNDGFEDDLPYAKKVSEHLGVPLDILKATPDIVSQLSQMIYHLDELQADPAPLNVLLICERAREQGVKVLLSGAGGDDIFSGYRRHFAIKFENYWSFLPQGIRKLLKVVTSNLPKSNAALRRISKAFSYADLDANERLLSYFFWLDPERVRNLFADDIKQKLSSEPFKFIYNELEELDSEDTLEKMLFIERRYFLVDHNFNYTDKMSMAHGVEVRVPFMDKRVVDAASKVPSGLKQKGRIGKWILKKAAEQKLPDNIIYRSKSGFGAPLREWLKGDLSNMVDEYLSADRITRRGIFNPQKVKEIIELDRSGKEDASYSIFALLCFEVWCQTFLDT